MTLVRKKGLYSWIFSAVILASVISKSIQMNETNATTTATPGTSTTKSLPTPPPPPPLSCIDKKVWNVCWLKTPPYIFDKRENNKTIVEGILTDAISQGLTKCECEANLNYTLQVYDQEEVVNCSKNKDIDLVVPFPRKGIEKFDWFFKVVDSAAIYLLLNRQKVQSQAEDNIFYQFSQVWTLAVLTILLAAIFGIIVWSLVSWNYRCNIEKHLSKKIYDFFTDIFNFVSIYAKLSLF